MRPVLVSTAAAALIALAPTAARIHHLEINYDARRNIELSEFGFEQSGYLYLNVSKLLINGKAQRVPNPGEAPLGLTVVRADEQEQFLRAASSQLRCALRGAAWKDALTLTIHWAERKVTVARRGVLSKLKLCKSLGRCISEECSSAETDATVKPPEMQRFRRRSGSSLPVAATNVTDYDSDSDTDGDVDVTPSDWADMYQVSHGATDAAKPHTVDGGDALVHEIPLIETSDGFAFEFALRMCRPEEAGLYAVTIHNCYKPVRSVAAARHLAFVADIIEKNVASDSYLSSGDVPLPRLYFTFAILFLFSGAVWLGAVHSSSQNQVYRVHHLMTVLVFLKCTALFFHGVHFYYISRHGYGYGVWAVIYYTMHFVKGALLFCVLILIGTGYTFYKNFLTDRDRKLFMVIIPLQVLANVALVILEETELGSATYEFWKNVFMLVDFACCAAVIAPVYWSIQHLKEASRTDGKAAFNMEKLKLFRQYYILVFCYIYVTRFIRFIIVLTVPFQYDWLVALAEELPTLLFYVFTGYKFRPTPNNPYLKLSQSDDEMEMEEAVTRSGVLDGVTRLKRADAIDAGKHDDRKQLLARSASSSGGDDDDDVIFSSDITQAPVVPRSASTAAVGDNAAGRTA